MPVAPIYIISVMLLLGAAPLPYGYYVLLRLVACGFFSWAALITYQSESHYLPWAFGLLAVLFNPFIKIYLPKEFWAVIDILSAIFVLTIRKKLVEIEPEKF